MNAAMFRLRAETAHAHASVDATFGAYDLSDAGHYAEMLSAHARALPTAERLIIDNPDLPPLRRRTPLLAADLATLRRAMPTPLPFAGPINGAGAWGIRYVVEGSRLGGGILAPRVGAGLPTAYLSDRHEAGEWRRFGAAFDTEAARHAEAWLRDAVLAAEACFDLYRKAAFRGADSFLRSQAQ